MGIIFWLIIVTMSVLSGVLPQRLGADGLKLFYGVLFPVGIALLVVLMQCSPSPAQGVVDIVECLLSVSALGLCMTLPVSLLVMKKSLRQSLTRESGLWFVVGTIASVYLLCGLFGLHGGFPFSRLGFRILELWAGFALDRFEFVVGISLAVLTFVGLATRLGPTIPCVLLGMLSVRLFLIAFVGPSGAAYEVEYAYRAAIGSDIMTLVFGAICGAVCGYVLDYQQQSAQPDAESNAEGTGQ